MTDSGDDPLAIVDTTLAEKYAIERLAGEGGFSLVYRATHLIWNQPVAIKFFNVLEHADDSIRESLLSDFIQEGKLMSELSSKSAAIVQARDIGKLDRGNDSWIPYMVLEWLDGSPLDAVLHREKRAGLPARTLAETMHLLEPVAIALDIAHKQNIAHRDLKPANIMIMDDPRDPDATVKVLDFGIAKVMAEQAQLQQQLQMTGQQITAFTPNHGAPEQFSRKYGATGPWTDCFAMALILLEVLLEGQPPLQGKTFYELGASSCNPDQRPTPESLGLQMSPEINQVFARATALQPADRFATMGEFWGALHRIVFPGMDTWRSTRKSVVAPGDSNASGLIDIAAAIPPAVAQAPAGMPAAAPVAKSSLLPKIIAAALGLAAVAVGAIVLNGSGSDKGQSAPDASATAAQTKPSASQAAKPGPPKLQWDGPCPTAMKPVFGGQFPMGSNSKTFKLWQPEHQVTIDSYCLAVNETTTAEYAMCVDAGGCKPAATQVSYPKPKSSSTEDHASQLKAFSSFCNAGRKDRAKHPINCVDWYQAKSYCKWRGLRLPTEAEWEYAARGKDGRKFPWGNDTGDHTYMNAAGLEWKRWLKSQGLPKPYGLMYEADDGFVGTSPVGRFPRAQTQAGHMDMVGNVWEWTNDWYGLYKGEEQVNPRGPAAGERKAIRGGGFNGEVAIWIQPAARFHQLATAKVHAIGFRCASNIGEASK